MMFQATSGMVNQAAKATVVFLVFSVTSVFAMAMMLENASGQFLEVLRIGEHGIKLVALMFLPLFGYLVYKAV